MRSSLCVECAQWILQIGGWKDSDDQSCRLVMKAMRAIYMTKRDSRSVSFMGLILCGSSQFGASFVLFLLCASFVVLLSVPHPCLPLPCPPRSPHFSPPHPKPPFPVPSQIIMLFCSHCQLKFVEEFFFGLLLSTCCVAVALYNYGHLMVT